MGSGKGACLLTGTLTLLRSWSRDEAALTVTLGGAGSRLGQSGGEGGLSGYSWELRGLKWNNP